MRTTHLTSNSSSDWASFGLCRVEKRPAVLIYRRTSTKEPSHPESQKTMQGIWMLFKICWLVLKAYVEKLLQVRIKKKQ